MEAIMKLELTIDRTKELPKRAFSALEKELLKRLGNQYENCSLSICRAGSVGLSFLAGDKEDKKKIETILEETWESADGWFY